MALESCQLGAGVSLSAGFKVPGREFYGLAVNFQPPGPSREIVIIVIVSDSPIRDREPARSPAPKLGDSSVQPEAVIAKAAVRGFAHCELRGALGTVPGFGRRFPRIANPLDGVAGGFGRTGPAVKRSLLWPPRLAVGPGKR